MSALRAGLLALALLAGSSSTGKTDDEGNALVARVTAYCLQGRSRSGEWVRSGMVATDPSVIPMYAHLTIDGLPGEYQALDTGGGVRGSHVDVWMSSCADALNWGVQYRAVRWSSRGAVAPVPVPVATPRPGLRGDDPPELDE